MSEPEITYHYHGRLRRLLLTHACPDLAAALRDEAGPRVLLVPTTSVEAVRELLRGADLRRLVPCRSGPAAALRHFLDVAAGRVVWLPEAGPVDPVHRCRELAAAVRRHGHTARVLPEPVLPAREVLRLVDVGPSALLDGSHPVEQALPKHFAALPPPLDRLVPDAWDHLRGTADRSLLSRTAFEERLAGLPPSVREAPLWSQVVDLWRVILRGLENDRVRARKWIRSVEARGEGRLTLGELNGLGSYEQAIFAAHALKDPGCLSYAAVVHGHYWMLGRHSSAALGTVLDATDPRSPSGGSLFEAG